VFEMPDPIDELPVLPQQEQSNSQAVDDRLKPFQERIASLFNEDIHALVMGWIQTYSHWNWDQLLSIFQSF